MYIHTHKNKIYNFKHLNEIQIIENNQTHNKMSQ